LILLEFEGVGFVFVRCSRRWEDTLSEDWLLIRCCFCWKLEFGGFWACVLAMFSRIRINKQKKKDFSIF
jgi:hypothetical protein